MNELLLKKYYAETKRNKSYLTDIATYSATKLGIVCDGVTDATTALRTAVNLQDNIIIKIPDNSTVLISDVILSEKNNVIIRGGYNSKIKLKDNITNDGLLSKFVIGTKPYAGKYYGLLSFYGKNSGVENLEVDGNIANNYVIGSDNNHYQLLFKSFAGAPELGQGGYNGVYLYGEGTFARKVTVKNVPWSGVSFGGWDINGNSINSTANVALYGVRYIKNRLAEYCYAENTGRDAFPCIAGYGTITRKNIVYNCLHHPVHDYTNNKHNLIEDNICFSVQSEKVDMYPGHIAELGLLQGICVNHSAYPTSLNYGCVVRGNHVEGDFSVGISVQNLTYSENYKVENNTVITGNKGIEFGCAVGENSISNNTIIASEVGIAYAFTPVDYNTPSRTLTDYNTIISIDGNRFLNKDMKETVKLYLASGMTNTQLGYHNAMKIIISNNITNAYKVNYYNCNNTYTNLYVLSTNNKNYLKIDYLYVSPNAANSSDVNIGTDSAYPLDTVAKAIEIANGSTDPVVIRILENITEHIKITNTTINNNLTLEGYDIGGGARLTREIGSLYLENTKAIYLYNMKPITANTEKSALVSLVRARGIRFIALDLTTYAVNGVTADIGSTCSGTISLSNKTTGINVGYASIASLEVTNVPASVTTGISVGRGGVVHKENTNLDALPVTKATGGVIFSSTGTLV